MKSRYYPFLLVLLTLLTSCEKELDIKYHDIEPLTVIEGVLSQDGLKVGITLTTPMDEPMDTARLTDARVTLTDITDGTLYEVRADIDGYYSNNVPGTVGHDYRLVVERNGQRFESTATMYPPTRIEELKFNWIKMPYDYVAVLQGKFLDNQSDSEQYYWVKLYRNGYIYQWAEVDDRTAEDGKVRVFTMTTRKDTDEEDEKSVLYDGDIITCTVMEIPEEMHNYLEALQNDSNGPFLFSGDRCLGYFIATSPVSDSITFHPDEIPEYK